MDNYSEIHGIVSPSRGELIIWVITSILKMLMVRGCKLSSDDFFVLSNALIDDKLNRIWKNGELGNFEHLDKTYELGSNDVEISKMSKVNQYVMKKYTNRIQGPKSFKKIRVIFIAQNGMSSGIGLINAIKFDEGTDIILVTHDKLSHDAKSKVGKINKSPDYPSIWHFTHKNLSTFVLDNPMAPDCVLMTDNTECQALVEPYEGDNFSRMPVILSSDLLYRVYGARLNNIFYIKRPNLDPNGISDVIVQIRVCA